jgi:hypothetical protein
MAMARPVLATRAAMDGIHSIAALDALVADEADQLAYKAIDLLRKGDRTGWGELGRDLVTRHYNWTTNLSRVRELLERCSWAPEGSRATLRMVDAAREVDGPDQVILKEHPVC